MRVSVLLWEERAWQWVMAMVMAVVVSMLTCLVEWAVLWRMAWDSIWTGSIVVILATVSQESPLKKQKSSEQPTDELQSLWG
jgi:hypothetical protein